METLKKKLIKQVGDNYKDYSPFCYCCIVWQAFHVLEDAIKINEN